MRRLISKITARDFPNEAIRPSVREHTMFIVTHTFRIIGIFVFGFLVNFSLFTILLTCCGSIFNTLKSTIEGVVAQW